MSELMGEVNGHRLHWLSVTKVLRLASLLLVGLSIVIICFFNTGEVGESTQWSDGNVAISAGSRPATLLWTAIGLALFTLLMVRKPTAATPGVPTRKRRVLALLIDFWSSIVILAPVDVLITLWIESVRTGHFTWHYQRDYSVTSDGLSTGLSLILCISLMTFYFAFPLTRGRQTIGCFITGLRVTPPFGDEGRFTLRSALMRTFYTFAGLLTCTWDQDERGRTWYDRKTACTVILVGDH